MSYVQPKTDLIVRRYEPDDEPRLLELLRASMGDGPTGGRTAAFFRWKHFENPFGPSTLLVAEEEARIVGLRAFMRWRFRYGGREVTAARAVDTATHPEHRRRGIFSGLTRQALELLTEEGIEFIFNTPNERSLPGYLKLGWRIVGRVPVWVNIRRRLRFASNIRSISRELRPSTAAPRVDAPTIGDLLADRGALEEMLQRFTPPDNRLSTERSVEYLRWRYASAPFDYRMIRSNGNDGGFAILRVRPRGLLWEMTVVEAIYPYGDRAALRELIMSAARAARVHHLAFTFEDSAAALAGRRPLFVRAPGGVLLVVRPLLGGWESASEIGSWRLSLGDIEVL